MSTTQISTELHSILSSLKVKDLPTLKNQTLVEFGKEDLIRDAFDALVQNSFLSAPVYDADAKKYIGMVDLRDIVGRYFFYESNKRLGFVLSLRKNEGPIVFTVDKLVNFSGMDKFQPISGEATLLEALEVRFHFVWYSEEFAKSQIHRMPIMKNESQVEKILTQSSIIEFLAQSDIGNSGNKTVGELEKLLGGTSGLKDLLLHIKEEEPAQKAFELMQQFNVHGVPVLDKDGKIVGNISVTDLQVFLYKWFEFLPSLAFLEVGHGNIECLCQRLFW